MRSTHIFCLMLAAALATPPVPAMAGKSKVTADQKLGMAIMTAVVGYDGNLYGGSGATESAYNAAGKFYVVKFARPVADCVSFASTLGNYIANGSAVQGASSEYVRVEVYRPSGGGVQQGFQLLVYCPQ